MTNADPQPSNLTRAAPYRQPDEGDLRRLMTLTAGGITAAGLLLLAVIIYAAWTANRSATERDRLLLHNAIDRSILRTLNEQKSVGWWDEAYIKISSGAPDLEFLDSEFGIFLSETYGHNKIFLLDPQDRPVFVYTGNSRRDLSVFGRYEKILRPVIAEIRAGGTGTLRKRPDLFGDDQRHYRTIGGAATEAHWSGHVIAVDGLPAVVTALTILPNVDMSLKKGTPHLLVSIKYIDKEFVGDIGRLLLMDDLRVTPTRQTARGVVSDVLMGDDGQPTGYLSWTTRRPGKFLLSIILPLVFVGVLAVAAQAAIMLRRLSRTSRNLARQELRSRHAARHDSLSGLPNRAHFADNLTRTLSSPAITQGNQRAIVAYIDIDRFKDVNDTLGHSAGDALIKQVADRLKSHVRSGDFIARYGGDEFAILWISSDPRAATILAERIANAFVGTLDIEGQSLAVSASIGIAVAPDNGTTCEEVMRHADIALYEAKNAGRNCAVVFSDDMAEVVEERRRIELDLSVALNENQLDLCYQPIISCLSGDIIGAEALLRWRHPELGHISPAVFIPIAEQCGLMPAVGEFVLVRAMRDWHLWPSIEVSVNLSPVQFRQPDLVEQLERMIQQHHVDPRLFVLEITEGVLMDAGERTRHVLERIRAMGFKTALDDFGTGYSSLAYLCNFQFDKIKIDRSFVSGLSRSQSFQTIVQSVITLGKGLGMTIVAEGVETESEALTMTQFGCSEMQGYFFAKPMTVASLQDLLAQNRRLGSCIAQDARGSERPIADVAQA